MAEDAARELPNLALEDALQLVKLYAERGSPKYEKAAPPTAGSPCQRRDHRYGISSQCLPLPERRGTLTM